MLQYVLAKYLNLSKDDEQYRHVSLILIYILSCVAITTFYCFYNTVIFDNPVMFYIDLGGTVLGLFALYALLGLKRVQLASFILLLMATSVCLLVIYQRGNINYNFAWALISPLMSIFLLGYLWGSLYTLAYFLLVAWIGWQGLYSWSDSPWTTSALVNVMAIYLLLFMFSCYFESSRRAAQQQLQASNKKLQMLATTDALTGLYNRRYMEDELLNSEAEVFFVMVDVDDFKHVNDQFGHMAGDEVLVGLAQEMRDVVGEEGCVGRWGGEEFVIIWRLADAITLAARLDELLLQVARRPFGLERPITISAGAVKHASNEHRDALRKVDEALYLAKMSGKNCYRLALND
ncbi:GGDEF domain-containing protein [Marinomonas ostreistagni]|uniref:GGDEF domain-containing protein n=1 Tax=Marinomonas ostreistagni TaxID=359209 RepID=UPI00194FE37E|nr:GGDEF domain-containing protein [Marinomonas ostreistagni]MBM6550824.1 GGDEF domain-containing protein [Marinomonas ostreistagni]